MRIGIEIGATRVFASAVDWPGWSRSARDESGALQALLDYAPRYAAAAARARQGFRAPSSTAAFDVVARAPGDATTDFGAPSVTFEADREEFDPARWRALVRACRRAFDAAADDARGVSLRKGPRGGGRTLAKIRAHVHEAEAAYVRALGGKVARDAGPDEVRAAFEAALEARIAGELPAVGPRGGQRWIPRYAVRRSAWHALDHAWEIQDRSS